MATIEDVARAVGVSRSTVSGAFSGKKRMTEERRAQILRVAAELHYEPNLLAQRLGTRGGHNVISLIATPDLSLHTRTLQALMHGLVEAGFEVDCSSPPYANYSRAAQDDPLRGHADLAQQHLIALFNRVRRLKPRAIIMSLPGNVPAKLLIELKRYREEGGVLVGYTQGMAPDFADWVVFDRYRSTYDAMRFLLDQGHRKIGYNAHSRLSQNDRRVDAMRDALAEFGVALRPEWIWRNGCYEAGGAPLAAQFLACRERPTALQVINDHTASSFVNALMRAGVSVPDEVSVIGNEDTPAAANAIVPLTTTSFPFQEMADRVIDLLQSRLDGSYHGAQRIETVRGQLIHRQSVRALATRAAQPNYAPIDKRPDKIVALTSGD